MGVDENCCLRLVKRSRHPGLPIHVFPTSADDYHAFADDIGIGRRCGEGEGGAAYKLPGELPCREVKRGREKGEAAYTVAHGRTLLLLQLVPEFVNDIHRFFKLPGGFQEVCERKHHEPQFEVHGRH